MESRGAIHKKFWVILVFFLIIIGIIILSPTVIDKTKQEKSEEIKDKILEDLDFLDQKVEYMGGLMDETENK